MLTLDTLRKMAERLPAEPAGASGSPPYRRCDAALRVRQVSLPTVDDERRRAWGLFAFVVGVALSVLVPTGVFVIHAPALFDGRVPALADVARTTVFFASFVLASIVPFAGVGLVREVSRFRAARERLGERVLLEPPDRLRSEDGLRSWPLRA